MNSPNDNHKLESKVTWGFSTPPGWEVEVDDNEDEEVNGEGEMMATITEISILRVSEAELQEEFKEREFDVITTG